MSVDGFFGGEVVPFAGARKDMTRSTVEEVRAYWEALRGGRPVPLRSEVDPRGIERALDYAFILERVAPQIARFRVAGGHLNDLMGMEVRGMPITAMLSPGSRPQMGAVLADVFESPAVAEVVLRAEAGAGRPELTARLLLLPMRSDRGGIDRALGCLASNGQIGLAPRRFSLSETLRTEIAAGQPSPRAITPERGFAESMPPFMRAPRSRAHLRLVKTDE
ncbi:PAS domain-containing protein [Albidovulum sediminicola]|uniref:PAS domain-containing protein n=1 Tax=Albidovulum sediminicola TaxID=2984331 RepID=A0ABT2Z3J6_9RHOB|nr:PAS domain-containing protein [Defluviimonas sp. WL0075]MCV2865686.1 PAS domain-containing protein [Defluviimonas sp. WL0075]